MKTRLFVLMYLIWSLSLVLWTKIRDGHSLLIIWSLSLVLECVTFLPLVLVKWISWLWHYQIAFKLSFCSFWNSFYSSCMTLIDDAYPKMISCSSLLLVRGLQPQTPHDDGNLRGFQRRAAKHRVPVLKPCWRDPDPKDPRYDTRWGSLPVDGQRQILN